MSEAPEDLIKRSVRLAGHHTSVSMERAFWDELKRIACADGRSVTAIIAEVDAKRHHALSRALRVYILQRLTRP